jgi:hypothetical protein
MNKQINNKQKKVKLIILKEKKISRKTVNTICETEEGYDRTSEKVTTIVRESISIE